MKRLNRYDVISVKHRFAKCIPYRHWAIVYDFNESGRPILFDMSKESNHISISTWDNVVGKNKWRIESLTNRLPEKDIQKNMDKLLVADKSYNLVTRNCEQTVKSVVQGKHQSAQVNRAATIFSTLALVGIRLLVTKK